MTSPRPIPRRCIYFARIGSASALLLPGDAPANRWKDFRPRTSPLKSRIPNADGAADPLFRLEVNREKVKWATTRWRKTESGNGAFSKSEATFLIKISGNSLLLSRFKAELIKETAGVWDSFNRDSPYWESSGSKGNLNEMVAS